MDALTQLDAWLEDHLPANLAALPTRIADSLSSTSQIIIDSSHTVITTLTQYGPVFPSSSSSSSPTASSTATNDDGLFDFWRTSHPNPNPNFPQAPSQGPPLSTPSSPAFSVRGMVLPPAPSASASPPTHPSNAPTQQLGHATTAGEGGGGSATPLSLSASVMELPSSLPSSA
ncbi:hypothetical protein A4X13_0g8206 [Tilletia indica]|uniref:Uncharacterized protein n=1 Tax=Tilletia indica TaxID=43049 RepID=A0A8T8SG50_9BASI|nr:hypothetical protein A4X13_0g8206 [Tilletia indica]